MPSERTFPHVQSIDDFPTRESVKQAWNEIHNQAARITTLEAANILLKNTVSTLQTEVNKLKIQVNQALNKAGSQA